MNPNLPQKKEKTKIAQLEDIENELYALIQQSKRNWIRTAILLILIEEKELYRIKATSVTQYVQNLAKINQVNISTLWRAKSALKLYMEIRNIKSIEDLKEQEVKATPEQLETFSKVRTIAPNQIIEEIKERMLNGEKVRHELKEIWKTYSPLKQGKTERGRKPKSEIELPVNPDQFVVPFNKAAEKTNVSIEKNKYRHEVHDELTMQKYQLTSEQMDAANIVNALRAKFWASETIKNPVRNYQIFHQVPIRLSSQEKTNKVDLMALVKGKYHQNDYPLIFGVSLVIKNEELEDLKPVLQNASFCNYYYLAVPKNKKLIQIAKNVLQSNIGLLTISDEIEKGKHEIKILKKAKQNLIDGLLLGEVFSQLMMKTLKW